MSSIEDGINRLNKLAGPESPRLTGVDTEAAHIEADKILLRYAPPEIRAAYKRVQKRCGGFWYA